MMKRATVWELAQQRGITRRAFLKFCSVTASSLGLPAYQRAAFAKVLGEAERPVVIWLSFQECTGCTESLTRSFKPTLENLILNYISLDYHHTLMAASGTAAEAAREAAIEEHFGEYILMVDGSVPFGDNEAWSTIAGRSNLQILNETMAGARLVINVGSCASFGGIPAAAPNPSNARSIRTLMQSGAVPQRPLVQVSGCPPVPEAITGTVAYFLAYQELPDLDQHLRPTIYFGQTVHDCCPRLPHFRRGEFAESFDDRGARLGHCLLHLGCKGPETFNACTTVKWNDGVSFPMHSGHGCLGCSEPNEKFWDRQGGFYDVLTNPSRGQSRRCTEVEVELDDGEVEFEFESEGEGRGRSRSSRRGRHE